MPDSIDIPEQLQRRQNISLAGRNIVVTGAASETGGAVSLAAARSGASVMLLEPQTKGFDSGLRSDLRVGIPGTDDG